MKNTSVSTRQLSLLETQYILSSLQPHATEIVYQRLKGVKEEKRTWRKDVCREKQHIHYRSWTVFLKDTCEKTARAGLCRFIGLKLGALEGPLLTKLSEEMTLLKSCAGEDSWESLGVQRNQTS